LDGQQFFDFHRAVFADAAKIVAAEVDEHDVLGTLLFARQHFALEALVFRFVFAAATRASDGPIKDVASLNLDEHFRGAADHGNVVELKIEKIGRGIQSAQLAIDFKRTGLRFHREALAQHDLENIAGPRSEEHTSELQSPCNLVCRLLLE